MLRLDDLPPDPYAGDPFSWLYVVFRPLADWPGYGVDTDGSVWSCLLPGRQSPGIAGEWSRLGGSGGKRPNVILCRGGKKYTKRPYRLVLEAFMGPCPPGKEACHSDDDQSNNRLHNLRWDSHKGNCVDRSRNGKQAVGVDSASAIYTEGTIANAKALVLEGIRPGVVASVTGVDRSSVSMLKNGSTWAHVVPVLDRAQLEEAKREQSLGTPNNVWLEHDGRTMIVADWAKALGLSSVTIRTRLSRGWTVAQALAPAGRQAAVEADRGVSRAKA